MDARTFQQIVQRTRVDGTSLMKIVFAAYVEIEETFRSEHL